MPTFKTEEAFAEWVETHDTAPFIDEMEEVEEILVVKRTRHQPPPTADSAIPSTGLA